MDEDGRQIEFEQTAIIPHDVNGETVFYVLLSPKEPFDDVGEDDAIVFKIAQDESGDEQLLVEEDEQIAETIFDKYYDLVKQVSKRKK